MKTKSTPFRTDLSIAELVQRWPQVIPVFLRHKMACVGCSMAAFETVESAAEVYRLDPAAFSQEIRQAVGFETNLTGS